MKPFTESGACRRKLACNDGCRDPGQRGDEWRAIIGRVFALPVAQGVWPCPRGVDDEGAIRPTPHKPGDPYPIPDDFDPQVERRRLRQGGCCGKPSTKPGGE